jgi:uncharacterized protein (DUF736 family)
MKLAILTNGDGNDTLTSDSCPFTLNHETVIMAVKSIQLGQVWRKDDNGQDYLVTKLYNELFSQYAILRPAEVNAPEAPTVRVKVAKSAAGAALPGFTFTQEGSF